MIALSLVALSLLGSDASSAYAASAVAHHRRADAFVKRGDTDAAIQEMRDLVATPAPDEARARDLQLDASGRLAELLLKAGRAPDAEAAARDGLSHARGDSALAARLEVALGDALEKQGRDDVALDAYQRAIDISRRLMTADGGGP